MPRQNSETVKAWLAWWPLALVAAFLGLMLYRARLVDAKTSAYVGCRDCYWLPSLSADSWLLAALLASLLLALNLPRTWAGRMILVFPCALLLFYIVDLFIFQLFGIRLFFVDLAVYGLETAIIWDQFSGHFGGNLLAIALLLAVLGACFLPLALPLRTGRWFSGLLALGLLASLLLASLPARPEYINDWIYRNFLQANLLTTQSREYSAEAASAHREAHEQRWPHRCVDGLEERPNVIIVIIESWSSYQSKAFGGFYDFTPELDRLSRTYSRFSNFHAGGFSTNGGLVNLLGGVRLWAPFANVFETAEFGYAWNIDETLPELFNRHDYQTALLTTGPLGFMRKGEWFQAIGFDHVEGHEHPFYADWPRLGFNSPADEALYRRSLNWLDEEARGPVFMALQTVTTHPPFIDPDSGQRDMELNFRYADRWAAWFYEELRARNFFDNGLLLITSDHRTMDPIRQREYDFFGLAAPSRIPMVVIGSGHEARLVEDPAGLSDVLPSFRHKLEPEACFDEFQASLFETPPHRENCSFHLRGSERGVVDVLCADGEGQVQLDGDATRFRYHQGLDPDRRERILDMIAFDRLQGLDRHRQAERESNE